MTGAEAFKVWAPKGAGWVQWVRPVLFVAADYPKSKCTAADLSIPSIHYLSELRADTALILDLPGCESVKEGLALSRLGWRPIPLYNGTVQQKGAMALVDNNAIEMALLWGASELGNVKIPSDAPPVFLLDSNRTNRHKMNVSVFDNSWDIYDQDLPSAAYFSEHGIRNIIVRSQAIQKDLQIILYKLQKKGIFIHFTNGYENAKEVSVRKPPRSHR